VPVLQDVIDDADKLVVLAGDPSTYAQATTPVDEGEEEGDGLQLGVKDYGGAGLAVDFVDPDGAYVETEEFVDGAIVASGDATHWALVDTLAGVILAKGALPDGTVSVTKDNAFAMTPVRVNSDLSAAADAFEHPNDAEVEAKIRVPLTIRRMYDTKATTICNCWKLTRNDGEVFGFTDHDKNLTFGNVTYEADSGLTGSAFDQQSDLAIDTQDLLGPMLLDRISEDLLAAGLYDNATIERYLVNWKDVRQRHLFNVGSVGEVSRGKTVFRAELRSLSHVLNQDRGRVYSKICDADVGDDRCTVDLTDPAFHGTGTVTELLGDGVFRASGLDSFASDWFAKGKLIFLDGQNSGILREVRHHSLTLTAGAEIELFEAQPFTLNVGDTFSVTAGCRRDIDTCDKKFDNVVNFRGFPFIPGNDIIMRTGSKEDQNDGSSLF
jgi:uncharacterized phage protein (TIGR02218 family)